MQFWVSQEMKIYIVACVLFCSLSALGKEKAMELCETDKANLVEPKILHKSLVKANSWAVKIYGSSCVTCAQIYNIDKDSFTLHITSPGDEDMIINTSATMEFNLKNGKVQAKAQYHSCYVRYVKK